MALLFTEDKTATGTKHDDGKLRYDLIPAYPMEQLAAVYTFGAHKYADYNWAKGIKYSRLIAALFRHFWAFVRGEDTDPESGLPHLAHALWNIFTLLYFNQYRKDLDDRFLVRSEVRGTQNSLRGDVLLEGIDSSTQNTPVRDPRQLDLPFDGTFSHSDYKRPGSLVQEPRPRYIAGGGQPPWYNEVGSCQTSS